MIPKILHFTWKTAELNGPMARYFAAWKALHPGWDIRLWTDETMRGFVAETYPELLPTYDGYARMIERADSFRYMVLGALGGVYSDLDVEPLRPIDALTEGREAFVGVEPAEHIAGDHIHAGMPFLVSNAFMGAVPGHPLFRLVVERLPALRDQATFFATGPSMLTASFLRTAPGDRPTLLLPGVWSPMRDGGLPTRGDALLARRLEGLAPIMEKTGGSIVSHKWLTTWVKWHERYSPFEVVVQTPTRIKWWLRRRAHPALAAVGIPDPPHPYFDQRPRLADPRPTVAVAIRLDDGDGLSAELAAAIRALDYPEALLRFVAISGGTGEAIGRSVLDELPAAEVIVASADTTGSHDAVAVRAGLNNALLERAAQMADKVMLIGGGVRQFTPDAVRALLGAQRPVTTANIKGPEGRPDASIFRYKMAPNFRTLWKSGGRVGVVDGNPAFRMLPDAQRAFAIVPVDGVGDQFVLLDATAVRAGLRFAVEPYKLHRNGEAVGIMARDLGFEAAALPNLVVTTG